MIDIKSLDDAVAYLRKRMEQARDANQRSMSFATDHYSQGMHDAFGEAIEAITGKPAGEVGE